MLCFGHLQEKVEYVQTAAKVEVEELLRCGIGLKMVVNEKFGDFYSPKTSFSSLFSSSSSVAAV